MHYLDLTPERVLDAVRPNETAHDIAERLGEPQGRTRGMTDCSRVVRILNRLRDEGVVVRSTPGPLGRPCPARWSFA
jgi:hypothetical protein